jgi:hypothetical protein
MSKKYKHDPDQPPYVQGLSAALAGVSYDNIWDIEGHEADAEDFDRGWENGTEQLQQEEV